MRLDVEGELRLLDRLQPLPGALEHLRQLDPDPLDPRRLLLERDQPAQHRGQRAQVARRRVDLAQRLERPAVARIALQHRLVGADRLRRVAQAGPQDPPELVVEPGDLAPIDRRREAAPEVLGQLRPALEPLQELLERGQRPLVAGAEAEQLAPELDRDLRPPQLVGERRLAGEERLAPGAVDGRGPLGREVREELLEPPRVEVEPVQRLERGQVARIGGDRLLVGGRGALRRGEPLLRELAEPEEERDPRRALLRRRLALQHLGQLRPGLEPAVEPLQRREGRRGRGRIDLAGAPEEADGARRLAERGLVEPAEDERHGGELRRRQPVERLLVEHRQLLGVARPLGELLQPAAQRRVGRVLPEGPPEGQEGPVGIPERPLAQVGELDEEGAPLDGIGPGRGPRLEGRRLAEPVAGRGVGRLERQRRRGVARVARQEPLDPRQRDRVLRALPEHLPVELERPVAVAEPRLPELGEPLAQPARPGALAGGGVQLELAGQDLGQLPPPLAGGEEPVEPGERLPARRIELQLAARAPHGPLGVPEPLLLERGEVAEEARPLRRPLLDREGPAQRLLQRGGVGAAPPGL